MFDLGFYKNKRVFVTGHTGYKGSWLCKILSMAGAEITGYALRPQSNPNLFTLSGADKSAHTVFGDIRDFDKLKAAFDRAQPELVFHLAAQPIVREGYAEPRYTYETNVMGTVNILECVRMSNCVKSFLNVTTDKVYRNSGEDKGYSESEALGGADPYSGSKSCSELVTDCYRSSFFAQSAAISTARAGNVIGGGDFARDRIIPDCVRAAISGGDIIVRNPNSVRPFQHVLEPLCAYLMIAAAQYKDTSFAGSYNVGPDKDDCVNIGALVQRFCDKWGDISWRCVSEKSAPREDSFLRLDCSRLKAVFGWKPKWDIDTALDKTVEWTRAFIAGEDTAAVMEKQIEEFLRL